MRRQYILLSGVILLIVILLLVLLRTSIPYEFLIRPQTGELNFTIIPEKTHVKEGENFRINLILTNTGNRSINLWKLEEQVSYNVFFFYPNGSKVFYECGRIERVQLTNKDLVEVKPSASLNGTIETRCWKLNKGEYLLSGVYRTYPGERIIKPYWIGTKQSNNVIIFVKE